jgi:transposase
MRQFQFSPIVLSEIERDRFRHVDPLVQRRMEMLWLKAHGQEHALIAKLAGVSRPTVQRVLDLYEDGGLAAVRTLHWKPRPSALTEHRPLLEAEFTARPPHTVGEACQRIEQLTGVRRGETQVREFLRETMGLRWRKVAAVPVPPKQTLAEHAAHQAAFLKDGP